ncbi:MAG: patatin-like phospholipase family protein [Proteobacteria bacterium]|nr:patatin-like phospholipase family protein [Pseudomonadota bacterium]
MKKILLLVLILTNLFCVFTAQADRPKVGLVLSGGGARGAAHIGVIEALEEMQVPIDMIVGTSMGAVIGGLYAAGVPIEQIERDFTTLNWEQIFSNDVERTDLYFRRKLDTDIFIIKNFISYSKGKIHVPPGIISGQSLYDMFNTYLLPRQPIQDFNHLMIPFKAVATDLILGKKVALEKGDLALSLLASMAVPGIIAPIPLNKYLLVDGGVSANLPIEIAKEMGADIVIVVDVGTPLFTRSQIVDLTDVLEQITNILSYNNVEISKSYLTKQDILLVPDVDKISTTDFDRFKEAVIPGRKVAFEHQAQLEKLSTFKPMPPRLLYTENSPILIDEVALKNETELLPETYFSYLDFDSNIVTPKEIKDHIDKLYGLSIFDRIYYGIDAGPMGKRLLVEPRQEESNPLYFQGSLLLDTDFQTTNTFQIVLGVTNQQMNTLLGEWRIIANIGQNEGIFAEYYQPLTSDLAWFINPNVSVTRVAQTFYYNYDPIALYLNTQAKAEVALGRNFSNWGRIRGYWQFEHDNVKRRIGPDFIPEGNINDGELGISFQWDSVDNIYFPHHGLKGTITLAKDATQYGGDADFSQLKCSGLGAISSGKHAFVLGALYNRTIENTPNLPDKFFLGGLFELTGLLNQELFGNNSALVSAIYYYQWKKLHPIPNRPLPIYLGASLEEGKVWGEANLSSNRFIGSGSVFLAADSILGPIYLALALTDTGRKAAHLTLRPVFN